MKDHYTALLTIKPKTPNKNLLLNALQDAQAHTAGLKCHMLELQAENVLNEMYCTLLHKQLANHKKKQARRKGKGKLMGDGLPWLLSGNYKAAGTGEGFEGSMAAGTR